MTKDTNRLEQASTLDLLSELITRVVRDGVTIVDADPRIASAVIAANIDDDGRSVWKWVRLPNGDLMLGTFPCGETYEFTELDRNRP